MGASETLLIENLGAYLHTSLKYAVINLFKARLTREKYVEHAQSFSSAKHYTEEQIALYGISDPPAYQYVTHTTRYVTMTREAYLADGQWSSPADDEKIFNVQMDNIRKGIDTDWVKLMTHNGSVQNNHIAISGGNEKTKFRLSSEYFNEKGLLKYDQLQRFVQHHAPEVFAGPL